MRKPPSKRYMTMIELLISLSLTMMVLLAITWFYKDIDTLNAELEKAQKESFQIRYLSNRLMSILPKAIPETNAKHDFYFYSSSTNAEFLKPGSQSLVFTFNAGTIDEVFSNNVLGRIFLDPNGSLKLLIWPSPARWSEGISPPVKQEILLTSVDNLQFQFFVAPDKEWQQKEVAGGHVKNPDSTQPEPAGEWISDWRPEFKQLPAMLRIMITRKGEKEPDVFVYPLPETNRKIVYTQ